MDNFAGTTWKVSQNCLNAKHAKRAKQDQKRV